MFLKRVCCSKSLFNDFNDRIDCLNYLGCYCVDYCTQPKAYGRETERESDANEDDGSTKTDEDDDSEIETEAGSRFGCTRTVLYYFITKNKNIPEHAKKKTDGTAARK